MTTTVDSAEGLTNVSGITQQASLLFTIFVTVTKEGNLVGRCLEIPKAVGIGKTLQKLRKSMANAISLTQVSMSEEKSNDAFVKYFYKRFYWHEPMSTSSIKTLGRTTTTFTLIIFAALLTVLVSFIVLSLRVMI